MKYAAVVFDLFGTLVNNLPYEEYQNILRQVASVLTVPFNDFRQLWSETAHERSVGTFPNVEANIEYICKKLGVNTDNTQIMLATKIRYNFVANTMEPREDALDALSRLKSQGFKIGLISNCSPETPVIWKNTPLAPLFDVAIFSCLVGLQKPDPRIYQMAVEKLAVKPENCLYIGDGDYQELSGASQVGMNPVLIRLAGEDGTQPHLIHREEWDDPRISSLTEVLALLKE